VKHNVCGNRVVRYIATTHVAVCNKWVATTATRGNLQHLGSTNLRLCQCLVWNLNSD